MMIKQAYEQGVQDALSELEKTAYADTYGKEVALSALAGAVPGGTFAHSMGQDVGKGDSRGSNWIARSAASSPAMMLGALGGLGLGVASGLSRLKGKYKGGNPFARAQAALSSYEDATRGLRRAERHGPDLDDAGAAVDNLEELKRLASSAGSDLKTLGMRSGLGMLGGGMLGGAAGDAAVTAYKHQDRYDAHNDLKKKYRV